MLDNAGFSEKPSKATAGSMEDIPEALRDASESASVSHQNQRGWLVGTFVGLGAIALTVGTWLTVGEQLFPSIATAPNRKTQTTSPIASPPASPPAPPSPRLTRRRSLASPATSWRSPSTPVPTPALPNSSSTAGAFSRRRQAHRPHAASPPRCHSCHGQAPRDGSPETSAATPLPCADRS